MEKKLQRIPYEGAIAGICAGLGNYFNIDKTWVRLAFILSVFFAGYGIGLLGPIVYVVLWIVLPVKAASLPMDPFNVDYRTAEDRALADPSGYESSEIPGRRHKKPKDRYVAGIILLMVGLFFLLRQLEVFYWNDFARFWPVVIMLLGVVLLISAFNGNRQVQRPTDEEHRDTATPASDNNSAGSAANNTPNHNDHE